MARTCTICSHPQRAEIELGVTNGASYRPIASQFGVGYRSVQRHMEEHIKQAAKKLQADREDAKTLDVLAQLRAINAVTLRILQATQANPKTFGLALQAIDRVQRQLELQAKLLGDLDDRPVVNVWMTQEWVAMRQVIITVLADYPEARIKLASALAAMEGHDDDAQR